MARRTRHSIPGSIYHVMLRGNNAQHIFISDDDRRYFYMLLQEGVERFGYQVLAFCLMGNHVHLAIRLGETPISKVMQNLSFRYTQYYNYNNSITGHLFQGRFKSILVSGIAYLRQLIRYIHLNPVRAGITNDPSEYLWSSHRVYLCQMELNWLERDIGLHFFGESRHESVERYQQFVLAGIGREEEIDFKKGIANGIVGDQVFIESMLLLDEHPIEDLQETSLQELLAVISEWSGIEVSLLSQMGSGRRHSYIRGVAAYLAQNTKGVSLRELADFFERADNTFSRSARKIGDQMLKSERLNAEIKELLKKMEDGGLTPKWKMEA